MEENRKITMTAVFLALFLLVLVIPAASAQSSEPAQSSDDAMAFMCMIYGCSIILPFILTFALAAFVYNDATKNGVENPGLWAIVVFFSSLAGLLIYFLVIKPQSLEKQSKNKQNFTHSGGAYEGYGSGGNSTGYCPHCNSYVGSSIGRCTYCGGDL